jgi:hypothetical protein
LYDALIEDSHACLDVGVALLSLQSWLVVLGLKLEFEALIDGIEKNTTKLLYILLLK